ncbi:MAG: nitroreductase family deazaflavin-dependent oxidoreductase [Actinobacteria bacterium]|nr:nitroreductase family deazaflavin-dependent oxidoreductase [Actinomycetota bacterium]
MTAIALSKPGTWFYANVASRIDPWLMRVSRGQINSAFRVVPVVLLTTRGAKSGPERTVPLVYFTEGDDVVLMASSFGRPRYPAWYHNLKANPDCHLRQGGKRLPYRAGEVEGPTATGCTPAQGALQRLRGLRGPRERDPAGAGAAPDPCLTGRRTEAHGLHKQNANTDRLSHRPY